MNTRAIGTCGENIAVEHLQKNGYKIVERNFNCRFGEIDIIALNDGYYVFVEVKSRNTLAFGFPREAVKPYKQDRIIASAQYWLLKQRKTGVPVRFDVVEVIDGVPSIITDAFRA